jgi:membrane protease subunit (stomatin/prohibitin family)
VDYKYALQVQDINKFRQELAKLRTQYSEDTQKRVISLLYPALDNYDQFAVSFVKMMAEAVDVSMLWGLLYLVIKVR